jgi:hypothetical protein
LLNWFLGNLSQRICETGLPEPAIGVLINHRR